MISLKAGIDSAVCGIKNFMRDTDGSLSSKRLFAAICMVLIVIAFFANLFWDFTIEEFIFQGLMLIVGVSIGGATFEKFAPKKGPKHTVNQKDTYISASENG